MRRAKIVCTLGPSSLSQNRLEELLRVGMDVARLNFSHGSRQQHAETIERLRTDVRSIRKALARLDGVGVNDLLGTVINRAAPRVDDYSDYFASPSASLKELPSSA